MQVSGEAYFFINFWMNFLSLYLAGVWSRLPVKRGRCLLSACLGGIYAVFAWEFPVLRSLPVLCFAAFLMAFLAFHRDFLRPLPLLFASAFLLSGTSGFLMENSVSSLWILFFCAASALCFSRFFRRGGIKGRGEMQLLIDDRGKRFSLPAFRDSGNLLSDPITALPVIVAPFSLLQPILPPSLHPQDLSTMPSGFHVIPIQTAGGEKTLMAFHPENLQLRQSQSLRTLDAIIALADFTETRALLPEAIFHQEEENHASL